MVRQPKTVNKFHLCLEKIKDKISFGEVFKKFSAKIKFESVHATLLKNLHITGNTRDSPIDHNQEQPCIRQIIPV